MRILFPALFAAITVALAASATAEPVGLVQKLRNTAYGTPPATARAPKQPTDGVEFNELIETVRSSAIEIGFVDGSRLTLGADSSIRVDEFVFDSDAGSGNATLTLGKGAVRWITGVMPGEAVTLETPTATIAIRGTTLKIGVRANGDTLVALLDGLVTARSKESGASADIEEGQSAIVTRTGVDVQDGILAVADPVVDGGWSQAGSFRGSRSGGADRGGGSSGGSDH